MTDKRPQRRLAAILAADVAGYSRLMGADEAGTLAALKAMWAEAFNPAVAGHGGRIVKMMGDGALVEFSSAVDAVEAALSIQQAMAGQGEAAICLRIGINIGDVVIEAGDIFGDGVNVAARLEAAAPKGGILVSEAVYAQIRGKVAAPFSDAGELSLKNIAQPVRAWRWGGGEEEAVTPAPAERKPLPGVNDLPSIAVLPFDNMSRDPDQDFLADGIVEDVITELSRFRTLLVIARNSTFAYRGAQKDVREIAKELDVRYVVEGSVRRAGDWLRVTAQLIEAATGAHIWAERWDRTMADLFDLQDELTHQYQ